MLLWIKDYGLTVNTLSLMISFPCLLSYIVSEEKSDVHFSFERSVTAFILSHSFLAS